MCADPIGGIETHQDGLGGWGLTPRLICVEPSAYRNARFGCTREMGFRGGCYYEGGLCYENHWAWQIDTRNGHKWPEFPTSIYSAFF